MKAPRSSPSYIVRRKLGSMLLAKGVSQSGAEKIVTRENLKPYYGLLGEYQAFKVIKQEGKKPSI
jgi:hypothetical protein